MKKGLDKISVDPSEMSAVLSNRDSAPMKQKQKAISLVSRPQLGLNDLIQHVSSIQVLARDLELEDGDLECLEVEIKYSGYIEKEQAIADKLQRLDYVQIPENFQFENLESLSSEAREKLAESQPKSLAEASRISGVSASDLAVLLVHLGR